ncbi:uncharacterized protein LOC132273131 [Cornus florida]|uniref:uncharacterized protein LOC132273131 n=1 Tax=Cornus florida TaxID=4283 RepID=UPI0028A0FB03|nr:uncharacterized protein LOC132273131 [Cornus florida]
MVNESPHGFFQPSRGLRQGCPLSPLLFTLVTEYLSSMFEFEYLKGNLVASPAAVKANCLATYQFFADDLLVVVRANIASVFTLRRMMKHFEEVSGLAVNKEKSEVYFTRSVKRKSTMLRILGCRQGSLPFTYLGLPISDRGIRRLDCKPLMDKVVAATTRWAGMNFSRAGRIELLRVVVTSMVLYWFSVYSIPAVNHSSIWKSIVSVRDTLKVQCSYRIGNDDKIKNFMDPWCGGQYLSEVFSYRTLRQWQFDDVPFVVQQFFQQFRIHGGEDQLLWNNKSFTFKAAWDSCRDSKPVVSWFGLVWNGGRPRWSVYSALIIQNAVLIGANLQRRGISLAFRCCLCGCNEEHVDHMFVKCVYAWEVWCGLAGIFHWSVQKLNSVSSFAADLQTQFYIKSCRNKVHKMLFTASMYYLWNE